MRAVSQGNVRLDRAQGLAVGGRMVIPVGDLYSQELIKLYKDEHGIRKTNLGGCRFVKLVGEYGWRA